MKTPYPFQAETISSGRNRNLLINDEVGCGKKLQCVEIIRHAVEDVPGPVLAVTVKRDKLQWRNELLEQEITLPVVIGGVEPIVVPGKQFLLILHYEALVRHVKALARIKWSAIVVDEAHYIKNHQAQRSRAIKRLKAHRKVASTGTPLDKSPADLWSILEWLYPETYRGKWRAFKAAHVRSFVDGAGYERVLPGARDPHRLALELAPFTYSRTKAQVAPDLPPNIVKHVPIELTGAQAAAYRRVKASTALEVFGPELDNPLYVPNRLAQLIKLHQIAVDPTILGIQAESAKLEWLRDWRDDNPDEPLIVFTNYRHVAQKLAPELDAHLIMGGVKLPALPPSGARQEELRR